MTLLKYKEENITSHGFKHANLILIIFLLLYIHICTYTFQGNYDFLKIIKAKM